MFPSDGFIFHPILNDRQDQTRCSGPVRASDRAEPYVCCREEGAGPSLNVRHPSWFTTTSREAQLVASSWRAAAASSPSRDVPSSYLQHPPLRFQAISNPVASTTRHSTGADQLHWDLEQGGPTQPQKADFSPSRIPRDEIWTASFCAAIPWWHSFNPRLWTRGESPACSEFAFLLAPSQFFPYHYPIESLTPIYAVWIESKEWHPLWSFPYVMSKPFAFANSISENILSMRKPHSERRGYSTSDQTRNPPIAFRTGPPWAWSQGPDLLPFSLKH